MKTILTRMFTVAVLMMISMAVGAKVEVELNEEYQGGKVSVKSQEDNSDGSTLVTITVTPAQGNTITHNEKNKTVIVYAVLPIEGQGRTRALEIASELEVTGPTDKISYPNSVDYQFTVPAGLNAWVQDIKFQESTSKDPLRTGYSGTYFIANETNHSNTSIGTHWYLVPGADPQEPHYADAYFHNQYCNTKGKGDYTGDNYGDPEKPFLTTYQTSRDWNSIWVLVSTNDGCYNIIHAQTGKYVVYEPPYKDAINRKSVHLESTISPDDDNAKFTITGSSSNGPININPKKVTSGNMYFNPATGVGNRPQYYGTGDYLHEGMIGLWSDASDKSQWYLEDASSYVCETPTITYNESNGQVSLSTTDGATIYYTLDGSKPTSSSTEYKAPFTLSSSAVIQAVAVKEGKCNSLIASKQLVKYVYNIVNRSGIIAIQYAIPHPVSPGAALSGYGDIPEAIRSSYINDEEVNFYSFSGTYNVGDPVSETTISTADPIEATPTEGTNIYITYTTKHLGSKFLHLQGVRPLNIKREDGGTYKYLYDNNGTLALDASSEASITTNSHLWYLKGATTPDPYDVIIQNSPKTLYLTYSSSALSLNAEACTYILLNNSSVDTDHEDITLKRLSDGTTFSIRVNPVEIPTSYYLIDKAGKIIFGPKASTSSNLAVPSEWESPLVPKYHYWKVDAFDEAKRTADDPVYELIQDPAPTEIKYLTDLTAGEHIYVTYDVDPSFVFDTTDDDEVGTQAYMLRFTGGETFRQENGKDALMTTAQKAVYPYSNGDAMLYVYGSEQWNTQLSSGASTRTRWLWYVVSPDSDPYHVYIMSHQGQASSHSYFRTYAVDFGGSSHIVTGVTTKNSAAASEEPTEYMILKQNGNCKLVTLIDGVQHTVNSFEQYWKNNPTLQDMLDTKVAALETYDDDITLDNTQLGQLETKLTTALYSKWHSYRAFANAAPWVGWKTDNTGSGKQYKKKTHWFQTIDMGSTGEFIFEPTTLQPQVILIDNHGWEVMRVPMYTNSQMTEINTAALRKYDSPMVETYHWYPTSKKTDGYHKYTVSDQEITVYDSDRKATSDRYTHNSTTLADVPYTHIDQQYGTQDYRVKSDFYVSYTVKPEYANSYAGAANKEDTQASKYLVKQGDSYAKISNNTMATETAKPDINSVPENMQWYVRPNFDIDKEMGYQYDVVKVDTRDEDGNVLTSHVADEAETNEDYVTAGKHGFDPYNVQIESVENTNFYFKTNTKWLTLANGAWTGTTDALSLQRLAYNPQSASGYDQTALSITNATFMVVDDGNGNMRLMPRFDNSKVVNALTGTQITSPTEATQHLTLELVPTIVSKSSDIKSMGGYYKLTSDFHIDETVGTSSSPFMGTIDGQLTPITGAWGAPLVAYAEDATIKNIIINNVSITENTPDTNVGAIVSNALGETRIFNCGILGGSVGGTKYVGGLVGLLEDKDETNKGSRVINCFSYADVNSGSEVGGIVGYNGFESKANDIRTMVMNCMFYGDITGGSSKSPVYGGNIINNVHGGLNNYNYYAYEKLPTSHITKYNCALAVEDKYLNRFEFYRLLLNSNNKLAAKYATSTEATVKPSDMMKWVLETADRTIDPADAKPYPILKNRFNNDATIARYPSIINYDVANAPDSASVGRNHGGKLGKTLSVTISGVGSNAPSGASITNGSLTLQRTDKDFDRFNFNYDKVQLPYYNDIGDGNYTENKVVTGWKITSMIGGTTGTYSAEDAFGGYNFADRKCTAKDIYTTSGRVFSQGAYFDVPYGVESITIEPYWGNAAYVADEYMDVVCNTSYTGQNVTQLGRQYGTNGASVEINGSSQKVYTSITEALKDSHLTGSTVYDNAVVLVGNLHTSDVPSAGEKAFTIMSVDLDKDNEPDYSYIYNHGTRAAVSPIRFDFLNVPGTAQAQKPNTATALRNAAVFKTKGWFELTNTALMYFSQIEYENLDGVSKTDAPFILQGGVIDQFVSTQSKDVLGNTIYIHVGGNAWFKTFSMGVHGDGNKSTPHVPVSVTGGDYDGFYLTGTYNPNANIKNDNAECYISGGRFGEVAGAGQEQIGTVGGGKGDIHWQIYNADIREFYGGGINDAKAAQGNIQTDIFNSYVDKFCGGPKFGNMAKNKTVVTNATGCTFGKYFGAGNGGNSYSRKKYFDNTSFNWNTLNGYYTNDKGKFYDGKTTDAVQSKYGKKGYGVATDMDYEFFVWTNGTAGVRFYVNFASFSLAQCNNVTSMLTNCIINQDFYGGGNLGSVVGTAKSTLDGCTVHGNVFGGGYSADIPKIPVRDGGFTTNPNFNSNSGMFEPGVFSPTTDYEWEHVDSDPANATDGTESNQYVKTKANLDALGQVANTDLTVTNNCLIEGGVYGGGDMSSVNENTLVKIENAGGENAIPNVYGGGNTADVEGNTEVRMTSGTVSHDIYGGGRGETTIVGGNVIVNMGAKTGEAPSITYSGTGVVQGDVYGGSALGKVNTTSDKTTTVNVYAGTINGSVFGGGLGQVEVAADPGNSIEAKTAIVAENQGKTTLNVEGGTVKTAVYGGANVNGVLTKDAIVKLIGGTVGDSQDQNRNIVFGGGFGAPTLVNGNVTVNVGEEGQTSAGATIYGHVYGGGALGNVNTSKPASDLVFDATKTTAVNLYKGTINGDAYGGGLGNAGTAAYVGGDVNVLLDGAKITGSIFGCNNVNGTPKGHVKVWVKRTVDSAKPTDTPRDSRTTYDVAAVYGGGNQADYVPTDATLDPAIEGNPAKIAAACAEVLIEGCDLTSIEYVYGGGNAAAVPASDVTILGSYIIDYVFGGGNGKSTDTFTNPGANIGIYKNNNVSTNYGSGKAVTKLVGGHVMYVFGGSNTLGNVRGGTSVTMPDKSLYPSPYNCCEMRDIKEIYGAGNEAEQDGAVTLIIGCVDNMDYVYGGARNANVKGGVDLVVTSGHFLGVFGGNDTAGSIQGPITVTIEETGCDPLVIDNLYLGGNKAPYSVYGYKKVGDNLVARTKAEYDALTADQKTAEGLPYADPVLNVVSCTSIGNMFGGGLGSGAIMYGSPTVNINMIPGEYATRIDRDGTPGADNDANALGTIGNVYGGGEEANVEGNTSVNICTQPTVTVRSLRGALVTNEPTTVKGALITENVFGAGKGKDMGLLTDVNFAMVSGNTTIVMADGSVAKSVYGGGELSQVGGNTNITVKGGTIGTSGEGGAVYGNIYGGGFGKNTNVRFGLVKGNTNVTVTGGSVLHSVYGGGAYGSVGTYTYASEAANAAISALASENTTEENTTGVAKITITGGTIGTDGHENGMVFGSSRGDIAAPGAIQDNMAWVYDTEVVIGTQNDETTGPTIHGSLYGSGENGHTFHNASVKMYSGTIGNPAEFYAYRGNVYGGGCGTDKYYADPANETHDGKGTLYNPKAGIVKGKATVEILGGSVANNIYGAGAMGKVEGNTSVIINTEGSVGVNGDQDDGNVYGAARGELGLNNDYASVTNSSVTITKGTVKGSVYGGGRAGVVTGRVAVQLDGGTVLHDVYGGGALAQTNTLYDGANETYKTYVTDVNLAGTTVNGDVYGGGLGQLASAGTAAVLYANVSEYNAAKGTSLTAEQFAALSEAEKTKTPAVAAQDAVAANVNGPVKVSVTNGSATNVFGCNNLNGAPQTTVDVEIGAKSGSTLSGSATVSGSVYGGGNMAAYTGTPAVKIYGGTVNTNVYGGGLGATAVTGGTSVTMEGGKVDNDVYGGGSQADVTGSVAVTIAGGTVTHDVYGGGALANTNTANWDEAKLDPTYEKITATLTTGVSVVAGLYKKDGNNYILQGADAKAVEGAEYYRRFDTAWAEGKTSASSTTTVTLTGGTIGNVFGGGLGNDETPVYVYGDVTVHLNNAEERTTYGGTGASFTREIAQNVEVGETNYPTIPITGKIFGANNFNGSPKGNVTVEIWATKRVDGKNHVLGDYEVHGVYGGGNLADYLPAASKQTKVIIHGCDETSIEYVYGGGNSASVPSTDVTIYGSFDIGYAFGGGNGSKPVKNSVGTWIANGGAMVTGDAKISARGGRIGQVFGGSDAKGDILGNSTADIQTTQDQECILILTRLFGAGNEADVNGDVNLILSGCSSDNVQFVHGGSYNAHITGNVNLTITSGFYTNVFGGNDARGSIGGNINVNIEETDDCKPIVIHNLVGGGNEAPYPGTKRDGTEYPDNHPAKVTVNVKSATRIDNVYGGGYKANVKGDTEVNINMMKGSKAGTELTRPGTYTGDAIPNVHIEGGKTLINDAIGTIGNVYGGGNEGNVLGSTVVNIGTATKTQILKRNADGALVNEAGDPVYDGDGNIFKDGDVPRTVAYVEADVLGAHVTGDVFGGGSMAYVTGNTTVNISTVNLSAKEDVLISNGSVYGGGSQGDVHGNANVTMSGGYVFDGVYGGGLHGSVGTVTEREALPADHPTHDGCLGGKPKTFKENTGKCIVLVDGGQVGPAETALATGGMKNTDKLLGIDGPVDVGFVFGAGRGEVEDPAVDKDADFHTFVKETYVTISGGLIMASVYGGGENGRVLNDTHVTISGGQIGCGKGQVDVNGKAKPYTDGQFIDPTTTTVTDGNALAGCSSWEFNKNSYKSYDPLANLPYGDGTAVTDAAAIATDGNTYYGSVFGGGSGYYPYESSNGTRHDWLRSAGAVYGNTNITISGGHILNSVYGGNETTDVGTYENAFTCVSGGKSSITMTGGTVGVPRTTSQIETLPVSGSLFGAGKGDHRTYFNTWTNINEVELNISGGTIYGSVFGGGEEGHVLGDVKINISGTAKIGTHGTTSYEGNVFGGGRGFSGVALTAGSTGGNVDMKIEGGNMLGSVYGGGRMSSVGIVFTAPEDLFYGQLKDDTEDTDSKTYGHVSINIIGGKIGKTTETGTGHPVGGNVYGGSMGRINYLNGNRNLLWPKQAVAKLTNVTISGGEIMNSVYGGGEIGIVRNGATVNVSGGTIHGNVFGGGYGSDEQDKTTISAGGYNNIPTVYYTFTPMIWTGCVSGDTEVNISGGKVEKNVYGGGNFASVGLINFNSDENGTKYNFITKHESLTEGFGLSWPYEFQYIAAAPTDTHATGGGENTIGGKATVTITGGRIGTTANAGYGNVYGGSKGMVTLYKEDNKTLITDVNEQRYAEAFCANVRETEVNINYGSTPESDNGSTTACIVGAVYGGGQDGHVYENANVTITQGLIGLSVYGGGQGESTFKGKLRDQSTKDWKATTEDVHSITAGKVYGNTSVSMTGGTVVGHVYGGGNLASVGKGNYAGGAEDYYPAGYGEKLTGNLWDNVSDNSKAFLGSGNVTVSITGGKVGTPGGTSGSVYGTTDATPTGMVFGGSRGRASEDVMLDPRHEYAPDFYLGYVNKTSVTIGSADGAPYIYSQVFGGGRDGHVRNNAHVVVNNGFIGQPYNGFGSTEADDYQRYHRGNVYGSGSGLGQWTTGKHGMSSGSVTNKTTVDINGGTIYNNVYGGGAMACVGPPKINQDDYATASLSKCTVNINGGTIGDPSVYDTYKYGGTIYGGSRGDRGGDLGTGETIENYATVLWTEVNINPHPSDRTKDAVIAGNVYGGARGGQIKKDTKVNLLGGVIKHNAYGGGRGTTDIPADVLGNTTVELNKGVASSNKGCAVKKVFGCNDLNGTPKGHALVHVYATQKEGTAKIVPEGGKLTKFKKLSEYTMSNYTDDSNADDLGSLAAAAGLTTDQINAYKSAIDGAVGDDAQKAAIDNYIEAIADKKYDVLAVYGGGDLAPYNPTSSEEKTEVIIDGCVETSIKQVYGGGNAASAPATKVTINSAYEIHESFGGGNGKDDYVKDNVYYENSGADVGYTNYHHYVKSGEAGYNAGTHGTGAEATPYKPIPNDGTDDAVVGAETAKANRIANYSYGTGVTRIEVFGGRIHRSYGGSNLKGNIRYETSSQYEESGACTMNIDETYGGSKDAKTDADIHTDMKCLDYTDELYGGSTSGDVNSNIVLNITNGTFKNVYGGNKEKGRIFGSITVNVKEMGCKPIIIGGLYAGGYKADYSIYGYSGTEHSTARSKAEYDALSDEDKAAITVQKDPRINVISATRIDNIYGGGFQARIVGNPHINVNMEEGTLAANYLKDHAEYLTNDQTDSRSGTSVTWRCREGALVESVGNDGILPIGTIGNIFGGGDQANIEGNTCIEIGTGKHHNDEGAEEVITPARNAAYITGRVYGGGNLGDVTGNTTVEMSNGYVADRIFGGGKEGNVGTVTSTSKHTGDKTHDGCIGKPTDFAANTGKCSVTVSGGYVGPFTYSHLTSGEARANVTITPMTMPDDHGYVFGAGRGELTNPATDKDIDFRTYVKETEVIIKNTYEEAFEGDSLAHIVRSPLIAGGVYGGSENGRVLNNTHVNIWGGQIGLGANKTAAYAETAFIDPTTTMVTDGDEGNALDECAAWTYGKSYSGTMKWLPYDEHADESGYDAETYGEADGTGGSDGHTFYGNVFGGGSGYFTYPLGNGKYEWLPSAGLVEGDTYVNISGGHILTNVYGGNEMTNVTGTTNVTMTGGTLGVPRTLTQIAAHPVTCYLFGGGKGDQRVHFNKSTNVGHAVVNVSGGIIYGSVFGGGEDGHVLGDVTMTISDGAKIGTWGTSYVDGNVFGGGRGFGGDAYTAGNVAGSITLNITGGTMLGSVYGGGRLGSVGYGLYAATEIETDGHKMYGEMQDDGYGDWYKNNSDQYVRDAIANFKRGYVTMNITGGTIGNDYEFLNVPSTITTDGLAAWKTTNHVPNTAYETTSKTTGETTTYTHRLLHTRGGNVYAGGMGRREQLDGTSVITDVDWHKLGNVKSTKLTMTGGTIKGNVYGGGEYGAVQGTHTTSEKQWGTEINITGGTIGTEIVDETVEGDTKPVMYTFGSVFGGGTGTIVDVQGNISTPVSDVNKLSAYVANNAKVAVTDAIVRGSVYGGGELSAVGGNTDVTISGTTKIGRDEVKPATDADAGYVMFGGWRMGNVYGGGRGSEQSTIAGLVKGNTNVTISGGNVYHNVYGGGALASVGTFSLSNGTDAPSYIPIAGVPYDWKYTDGTVIDPASPNAQKTPTGTATVTITGGTIGISGRDNGLVFGSSRGDLTEPVGSPAIDPYDRVAWVNKSVVNIGTENTSVTSADYLTKPLIKCSVYGGGENGHNNESATVNVYSGTIGIVDKIPGTDTNDPWYSFTNKNLEKEVQLYRGNVYGAGSGSDTYKVKGVDFWNPKSGMVGGNTFVNIAGGHVGRSVYGGGAMASVGTITNASDTIQGAPASAKHDSETTSFALSWPYEFKFADNTGKATVNVTGGHIGTYQLDGGDVYGSSRGLAGDRYKMAHLALTNETEVNITYPSTIDMTSETAIQNDFKTQCITGSVHGSGENGYVYGDAKVTLNEGLIGHSLYGAGKGNGTYTMALKKIGGSDSDTYNAQIYSLIAGKVMGNTFVTMNGGRVGRNVYGGGNMGSVGKGNYAGGADDYYPTGYGETIAGNLWTTTATADNPDDAYHFLHSGKATVNVIKGIVGYIDTTDPAKSMKNQLPYGNVIGGSAGEAAPNIADDPRYLYSPAFFSGYVNETDVTIGGYRCKMADGDYKVGDCITATQYDALSANQTNWELVGPTILASVYGGGQDGHVRRDTYVKVLAGEIGIPYNDENRSTLKTNTLSQSEELDSPQWMHRGNVYGGGSGITKYKYDFNYDGDVDDANEQNYSNSSGSVTRFTTVEVKGGTIHRNVYGGGSMGSVGAPKINQDYEPYKRNDNDATTKGKQSMNTVIIGGGTATTTIGSPDDYKAHYGGEVYGACRGDATLDAEQFGTSIWTQVLIKNGANILGNVFGGGDAGKVKRDAEVIIGEPKQ